MTLAIGFLRGELRKDQLTTDILDHTLLRILFLLCGCALRDQQLEEIVHLRRQHSSLWVANAVGSRLAEGLCFSENGHQYLSRAALIGKVIYYKTL